jgi:hypothetical protein
MRKNYVDPGEQDCTLDCVRIADPAVCAEWELDKYGTHLPLHLLIFLANQLQDLPGELMDYLCRNQTHPSATPHSSVRLFRSGNSTPRQNVYFSY